MEHKAGNPLRLYTNTMKQGGVAFTTFFYPHTGTGPE